MSPRHALPALGMILLLSSPSPAAAVEARRPYILDHGAVDLVLLSGAWRSGIAADEANPGFSVLAAGGELALSLDVLPGFGIVVTGRAMAGPRLSGVYVEGLAGLGPQLRLSDWVRIRLGIAAGQAILTRDGQPSDRAVLLGGFATAVVDLFRLGRGRAAVEAMLRLDVDGHLISGGTFPRSSLALTVGVGFRL